MKNVDNVEFVSSQDKPEEITANANAAITKGNFVCISTAASTINAGTKYDVSVAPCTGSTTQIFGIATSTATGNGDALGVRLVRPGDFVSMKYKSDGSPGAPVLGTKYGLTDTGTLDPTETSTMAIFKALSVDATNVTAYVQIDALS